MKITAVRSYDLRYPLEEPFANSQVWNKYRTAGVLEILTDAGIVGWGEGLYAPDQTSLESRLVGRDPLDIEVIWQDLYAKGWGDIAAFSAVDIALWDILGKSVELPIYKLLGGAFRDRIPAYASGLFKKDVPNNRQALMDEARGYVENGFEAVKMKIGFGQVYDTTNVAAVRSAIGEDVLLAVDANCGYDASTAIDIGNRILDNNLFWYEEPISTDNVAGYKEVRKALKVRIAGGEMLRGCHAFRDLIQDRGVDIIQPDISVAGGFSECRKIAAIAAANHVRLLPHMWGTSIRLAATIHWQATIPDSPPALNPIPSLFEFDMTENRLRTELALEPIQVVDGYVPVLQAPGLGIEINRELLEAYAV